jgi:hypothetical protein
MTDNGTIAGLPVEKFINRRVRLKNKAAGHHRPATLLAITSKGKVEVKPDSHRGTDIVELDCVHPWWAQNPDLKVEYDELYASGQVDKVEDDDDSEEAVQEEEVIDVQLPKMTINAGADPYRWIPKVEELKKTMIEEVEVRQMLKPVLKRKEEVVKALSNLGVQVQQ